MGFGKEDHRGKVSFSSHHMQSIYYQYDITADINPDDLPEVVFVSYVP